MTLTHTDDAFLEALRRHVDHPIFVEHTGGGVMVTVIDLTIDERGQGAQVWITRDDDWLVGFYDFAQDVEDEGECLAMMTTHNDRDDAEHVAQRIARVLTFFDRTFVELAKQQNGWT